LVTVALKSWHFNCSMAIPSRRGFVRLRADATRPPVSRLFEKSAFEKSAFKKPASEKASLPSDRARHPEPVACSSNPVLLRKHSRSEVSYKAVFRRKSGSPRLFLVPAFLGSFLISAR
jgi:hypothetical protein